MIFFVELFVCKFYVKQINFDSRRASMAVSLNFTVSQSTAATQLRWGGTKTISLEICQLNNSVLFFWDTVYKSADLYIVITAQRWYHVSLLSYHLQLNITSEFTTLYQLFNKHSIQTTATLANCWLVALHNCQCNITKKRHSSVNQSYQTLVRSLNKQ